MIGLFDLYDLMPHTDCGKCIHKNCLAFAKALIEGKVKISECSCLKNDSKSKAIIEELLY